MSAGGQNSSTLSGIQGTRLRETSGVVAQIRVRGIFQMFNSSTPNAVRPRIRNGNDVYLQFLQGIKESSSNVAGGSASCTACAGLTYNGNGLILTYRNGNFPPV
jgi:hypothetical protein